MLEPSDDIQSLLKTARCLYTLEDVEAALSALATRINTDMARQNPVLLPVMNGGLTVAAGLLRRLNFPLQVDYLHVTRYRNTTRGGDLDWIYEPRIELKDRNVLVVDDLLDLGITLQEVVNFCHDKGASSVKTAVLVLKQLVDRPGLQNVDYYALETPDHYLFGYGMDYQSYWRNAPGIFAIEP